MKEILQLPSVRAVGDESFPALLASGLVQLHRLGGGAEADTGAIAVAARRVGEEIIEGRVQVPLSGPELGAAALEQALRRSPVVAAAACTRPLVLDGGHLYLARYWDYQQRFNNALQGLNREVAGVDLARLRVELDRLFGLAAGAEPDQQKLAAATGVLRHLCVISGGPGTGKTTTVVKILAILLALDPELKIAIAAPTGKAAARVQESIRQQAADLELSPTVAASLPGESHTLHRLLGYQRDRVGFRHHRGNPLPHDVVVVDEASMLDLALAAKLTDALKEGARLILLGDKDQLSSVEAGAVYAGVSSQRAVSEPWAETLAQACGETVASRDEVGAPLADAVVWLERSYRFAADSVLGNLARAIRTGTPREALALLRGEGAELAWTGSLPEPAVLAVQLAAGYADYVDAVRSGRPVADVFAAFDRYRVLCSTRTGRFGSERLGALMLEELRAQLEVPAALQWFIGRPLLVTRNDYTLRLFNGDVGIVLPGADGEPQVHFQVSDGSVRQVSAQRLDGTEEALAITVHRAQGSEFDRVALVIDPEVTRGLSRQLVYTGVTRAKEQVTLFGGQAALARAISGSPESSQAS